MFWILFAVGQLRVVGDWDEMTLVWLKIMMKQSFNDSFIIRYHSIINRSCTALPSRSLQVDHNVNERRCIWHSTSSHPRNNNSRIILRATKVGQTLVEKYWSRIQFRQTRWWMDRSSRNSRDSTEARWEEPPLQWTTRYLSEGGSEVGDILRKMLTRGGGRSAPRHDGRSANFRQNVARFRLYRLRFLQVNMRFAAFFKIYQII